MNSFKTAQHIIPSASGIIMGGFNTRIYGETRLQDGISPVGFYKADDMILDGKIYFVNNFHNEECDGHAYQYGGFWVCNTCGKKDIDKYWWKIKVYKDGNEWCCVGEGFINLQASSNYAFGKTRELAMKEYAKLYIKSDRDNS